MSQNKEKSADGIGQLQTNDKASRIKRNSIVTEFFCKTKVCCLLILFN